MLAVELAVDIGEGGELLTLLAFELFCASGCPAAVLETGIGGRLDATNVVLMGPNGVGKSMLACNLGHQALIEGKTVLFTTAGQLLGDLAALDSDSLLRRRIRHYAAPDLLLIDEVGYLSYSNRHADLLFELISRRYEHKSTVITTNRAFKEWGEVFPNAACTVSLIDRLVHRCEVVAIEGESYRLKEAKARAALKAEQRRSSKPRAGKS